MAAAALGLGLSYPQQVATSPQSPPPPPSAFNPSDLWLGSEAGGWWDLSDLSTLRIARDGSGASPTLGEPVGHVVDQGPNGLHLEALSDSARPIVVQQGPRYGLRLDGLADFLRTTSEVLGPDSTTIIAASSLVPHTNTDGLFGLDSLSDSPTGTYRLVSNNDQGLFRARLRSTGLPQLAVQSFHVTGIFTLIWDFAAGTVSLRANGSVIRSESGYLSSIATRRVIFGADRTHTSPLESELGAIIHIGRSLAPSELTDAEAWATARLLS